MQVKTTLCGGAAALAALLAAAGAHAGGYNFTTIAPPPGTPLGDYVQALSINDGGQILVSALGPSLNPTTGVNQVDVDDLYDSHTQTFTAIPEYPGSIPGATLANGVNDSGQIVGQYEPPTPYLQAFSYAGGVYATLPTGGTNYNFAIAISNNGMITGDDGTPTTGLGFVYAGGAYTYFSAADPTTFFITGEGINSSGTVVGVSGLLSGGDEFSFVDLGGVISYLPAPGETATLALAINDGGVIAGAATSDGYATFSGFVDQRGAFTEVEAPGSTQTEIQGINNQGDIVGEYYDANGNEFAFLATPVPEPGAWALMLVGLAGVGLAARRRPAPGRLTDRPADDEKVPWRQLTM